MNGPRLPIWALVILAMAITAVVPHAQHTRLFKPEDLSELEQPDRDEWQRPDKIMDVLGIGEASFVADLGAGSGWFTIKLAGRVGPNGMVYAEDIQRPMIQAIKIRVDRLGLKNVTTVLGKSTDPQIPVPVDAVLICDAYHEWEQPVALLRNMREAGRRILRIGPRVVLVKGGHLEGPDSIDVACTQSGGFELRRRRIVTKHTHGTGCTLSSAIAANLARGLSDREAIEPAREYLDGAIRHAPGLGAGHGPLNHFWRGVY